MCIDELEDWRKTSQTKKLTSEDERARRLAQIETRLKKMPEGPYYVASDDAPDCPAHKNSGLALVDTGRSSDWPIARLCEWDKAHFIAAARADIPYLLEEVKRLSAAVQAERIECAKAVCRYCRDGMPLFINQHQGKFYKFACEAWAIHERGSRNELREGVKGE